MRRPALGVVVAVCLLPAAAVAQEQDLEPSEEDVSFLKEFTEEPAKTVVSTLITALDRVPKEGQRFASYSEFDDVTTIGHAQDAEVKDAFRDPRLIVALPIKGKNTWDNHHSKRPKHVIITVQVIGMRHSLDDARQLAVIYDKKRHKTRSQSYDSSVADSERHCGVKSYSCFAETRGYLVPYKVFKKMAKAERVAMRVGPYKFEVKYREAWVELVTKQKKAKK